MLARIREVFTKDYGDSVQNQIFLEKHIDKMKLKNKSESIDKKISRLKSIGDVPVFRIKIGSYK